ncbi:MAG TPA: transporter substrate-binding domain-containing protein [Alphaproteobacteria bacterium]|nr:transporter substrate-binding domain-containing protein [Alphaproteobacteria bacterium]
MMKLSAKSLLVAAAAVIALGATTAKADVLQEIKARGALIVGVKADYRPFGYRSPSGDIIGFEPDLARDVAKRLGVKIEFVPVVASNRMQFLDQGKIDLMIATMNDTPERHKVVDIVEPDYYASGVNIMVPKSSHYKDWEQLKGKKVCLIQGSFYNKELQEKYGIEPVAFKGTAEAYSALKDGNCVGMAYDDTALYGQVQLPEWKDYEVPFKSIDVVPWGLAVKLGETNFANFMSKTITDWHKTGFIIKLEKKWGIPPSPYAAEMHEKYK